MSMSMPIYVPLLASQLFHRTKRWCGFPRPCRCQPALLYAPAYRLPRIRRRMRPSHLRCFARSCWYWGLWIRGSSFGVRPADCFTGRCRREPEARGGGFTPPADERPLLPNPAATFVNAGRQSFNKPTHLQVHQQSRKIRTKEILNARNEISKQANFPNDPNLSFSSSARASLPNAAVFVSTNDGRQGLRTPCFSRPPAHMPCTRSLLESTQQQCSRQPKTAIATSCRITVSYRSSQRPARRIKFALVRRAARAQLSCPLSAKSMARSHPQCS